MNKIYINQSLVKDLVKYQNNELCGLVFTNKWILPNNKSIETFINTAITNFGLNKDAFTYEELDLNYKKCLHNIIFLAHIRELTNFH